MVGKDMVSRPAVSGMAITMASTMTTVMASMITTGMMPRTGAAGVVLTLPLAGIAMLVPGKPGAIGTRSPTGTHPPSKKSREGVEAELYSLVGELTGERVARILHHQT